MDTLSRVLGGWVVACVIGGVVLIATNSPVGIESWTDQRVFLVRLGIVVIGLGIAGLAAEVMRAISRLARRREPPASHVVLPVSEAFSPEIEQMRQELSARQAAEHRQQRSLLRTAAFRRRDELANLLPSEVAARRESAAWAEADAFDRDVRPHLKVEDLADYDRPVDPVMLSNPDWNKNVAAYYEIKGQRIPQP